MFVAAKSNSIPLPVPGAVTSPGWISKLIESTPSPPSTVSPSAKLTLLNVSLPAPPISVSAPPPPVMLSLPAPPSMWSSPPCPSRVSFPVPPVRVSSPLPAKIATLLVCVEASKTSSPEARVELFAFRLTFSILDSPKSSVMFRPLVSTNAVSVPVPP